VAVVRRGQLCRPAVFAALRSRQAASPSRAAVKVGKKAATQRFFRAPKPLTMPGALAYISGLGAPPRDAMKS
jgi:hypothetical protein